MMNCLLCLNINESGKKSVDSSEWKELNVQYIVEKYLWKMENLNNRSYICQTCWQELSNFHNFYLKIEKANSNLNILVKSEVVSEDVLRDKGDLAKQTCIDSNENSEISPKILFVKEESPLEIFDAEEESCFEGKEENVTLTIKPEDKRDLDEQICIEDKETSQIESEILFSKQDNPLRISEKEDVGEVSSLKNTTKRKQPLRKSKNDKKNIAKNNPKKRLKKEKVTKSKDNKNHNEIDIKLREVENDPKLNKLDEHFNDQKDNFGSAGDPDSSKLERKRKARAKFIAEHFQFSCSQCDIPLATFDIMVKHYKEEHNQRGYATCCDQKLFARYEIVDHIKFHQNPEYFKCTICDKVSVCRSRLTQHINYAHKKKNVECDICGRRLANETSMRRHKLIHGADKNKIHCELCDKSYFCKASLNSHMQLVHLKRYKICGLCGKSEKSNYRLKIHMLMRHNEKGPPKVCCEVCGRVLSTHACLKRHINLHHPPNGINPEFKCPVCKKVFKRNILKSHIRKVHQIKCTLCNKKFKEPDSLKHHMSTHTGKPLRTCTFCPRTFYSYRNMYAHRRRAHPIEYAESARE